MEVISSKRYILLALAMLSLLTSNSFCADELMMPSLHSKENYHKYSEPTRAPMGEKETNHNFEQLKDWGPKNANKMSSPTVKKMQPSAANLPLRFGRTTEEERNAGERANLPLKFGRYMKEGISRRVPNMPQRFGRTTTQSVTKTLSDFLQHKHSPSAVELTPLGICQPQHIQNPGQKHPRTAINQILGGIDKEAVSRAKETVFDLQKQYGHSQIHFTDTAPHNTNAQGPSFT
ncbi:pro-FMRFamide-related neuropeptide VF [Sorex fumeus]|uniref:pro-FMRFamide-related neuropeptide VF n=1 Tax=Sorex fumeus TaxID=62283 RepID=UPI0024ADDA72|nr:pro-FMRFamide-related neuropeptide VF [Sorex fumeus]